MSTIVDSTTESDELNKLLETGPPWAVFCGNMAPAIYICLRLSPIPTVIRFVSRGNTGSLPIMPYTALLSDGVLWLFFGILTSDTRLIVTNACGSCLAFSYSLAYAFIYSRMNPDPPDLTILPGTLKQHMFFVFSVITFCLVITLFLPSQTAAEEIIGFFSDMGSLFMYAGPLSALRAVLREKDATSLPLPYTIACLLNGFSWGVYGWFVVHKIVLWAPSIVGVLLASMQLGLIVAYGQNGSASVAIEMGGGFELREIDGIKVVDAEVVEEDKLNGNKSKSTDNETGDVGDVDGFGITDDDSILDFVEDIEDDAEFDSFLMGADSNR